MSEHVAAIREQVVELSKLYSDHPDAHALEDSIHTGALYLIASGQGNPAEIAAAALETLSLGYRY